MTRDTGQITRRQALIGGVLIVVVGAGLVFLFDHLIQRPDQVPPLEAPAEPVTARPCPERPPPRRSAVTSNQLIECPGTFDGAIVRYRGEVVRAVLLRDDRAWVHLNDDLYGLQLGPLPVHRTAVGGNSGIPVSIPADAAMRITHVGNSRHQGDILEVTGAFRRADPNDAGGPAIRSDTVTIVQAGKPVSQAVQPARIVTAILCALVAALAAAKARLGN